MEIFVETERLILREILLTDIEGMFELDADPEVHQYLGNQPVSDIEKMKEVILFVQQHQNSFLCDNAIHHWYAINKNEWEKGQIKP